MSNHSVLPVSTRLHIACNLARLSRELLDIDAKGSPSPERGCTIGTALWEASALACPSNPPKAAQAVAIEVSRQSMQRTSGLIPLLGAAAKPHLRPRALQQGLRYLVSVEGAAQLAVVVVGLLSLALPPINPLAWMSAGGLVIWLLMRCHLPLLAALHCFYICWHIAHSATFPLLGG